MKRVFDASHEVESEVSSQKARLAGDSDPEDIGTLDLELRVAHAEDDIQLLEGAILMEHPQCSSAMEGDHVLEVRGIGEKVAIGEDEENFDSDTTPEEVAEIGMSIIDNEWAEEGDGTYPEIWTQEMWLDRRAKHHWLSAKVGRLGCRYCCRVKHMGVNGLDTQMTMGLSTEWITYKINYSGESREQQLKSLRNKIQRHEVSKNHLRAEELIKNVKDNPPSRTQLTKALNNNVHMLSLIFKDVYSIVKNDIDFESYRSTFNSILNTKFYREFATYQEFDALKAVDHFAEDMRAKLCIGIMENKFPLAVVVDSVDGLVATNESVFLIYLRAKGSEGLRNYFWDAVLFSNDSDESQNPLQVVTQSLQQGGFSVDYLSEYLLCFVTHPLGEQLGASSSLCNQLAISFDKIVIWYVIAYRLESMVQAAFRNIQCQSHVAHLYEILHSLTQLSERNVQELLINTPGVYEQLSRIGCIVGPAEVASSFKAVHELTEAYPILYEYMVQAGNDSTRMPAEKEKYSIARSLMESDQFVRELAVSYDVLSLLANVRNQIDGDCDMAKADCILVRTMEDLAQLQVASGQFETAALGDITSRIFLTVPLNGDHDIADMEREAFMEQIVALSKQFMISVSGFAEELIDNFIRDLHAVKFGSWPENPPKYYADKSVRRLCSIFELKNEAELCEAFQTYIANGMVDLPERVTYLQSYTDVFPCSSTLFAQVVEKINKLTTLQDSGLLRHLAQALFVNVNGKSVESFESLQMVKTWCTKNPFFTDVKNVRRTRAAWAPVQGVNDTQREMAKHIFDIV